MIDLNITGLNGQSEMLTGYIKDSLAITKKRNGEYSLSCDLVKTSYNQHAYPLVENEIHLGYKGQKFVIKAANEKAIGNKVVKSIRADHVFFETIDHYFYDELLPGEYEINELLALIFDGSYHTYEINGTFEKQYFDKFGPGNLLFLINLICNKFGVEVERDNYHVIFKNQVGRLIDFQFRFGYNTKSITKQINTDNLSTVIRGYADKSEYGIYMVEAEYRSPWEAIYGERHAEPVYADDLVLKSSLEQRLKETINDEPKISYAVEFIELKKQGFPDEKFDVGDTVFTIYEPVDIDIQTRIMEYTFYPHQPNKSVVVLANFNKNKASDIIADLGRTKNNLDKIITDSGKVRFSAMEEQIQRSTEALLNSMTELEYPPEGGIIARDVENPDEYLHLKAAGFGIYKNGQLIEAITTAGFNLSAGVIGKLTADNIDATNLEVNAANIIGTLNAAQVNVKNKTGNTFTGITHNGLEVVVNGSQRLRIFEDFNTFGITSAIGFFNANGTTLGSISGIANSSLRIYVPTSYRLDIAADTYVNESKVLTESDVVYAKFA